MGRGYFKICVGFSASDIGAFDSVLITKRSFHYPVEATSCKSRNSPQRHRDTEKNGRMGEWEKGREGDGEKGSGGE